MHQGAEDGECSMAQPSREEVETRRRHAIGLGWHLPSVTLLLTLAMAQILPVQSAPPWTQPTWTQAQWQEHYHVNASLQESFFDKAVESLSPAAPPADVQNLSKERWMALDLEPLARYEAWRLARCPQAPRGMDIAALSKKGQHKQQRKAGRQAALISPWIADPVEHFEAARKLEHPHAQPPMLEDDMWYPLEAAASMGTDILQLQRQAEKTMQKMLRACAAMDRWALSLSPHAPRPKIQEIRPFWIAVVIAMLQWPDTSLPRELMFGFQVYGVVPTSNALRQLKPEEFRRQGTGELDTRGQPIPGLLFGAAAEQWIAQLESAARASPAEVLTEIEKEVKLGILGAERSKQSLDREFGLGGWHRQKTWLS